MRYRVAAATLLASMLASAPVAADRDFDRHPGYRGRPFDPHRHYQRHEYRGRPYDYRGHWRSWDEWDGYYRAHPRLHRHGHYYDDGGHLMFRWCEPDSGGCFFFSIGR